MSYAASGFQPPEEWVPFGFLHCFAFVSVILALEVLPFSL